MAARTSPEEQRRLRRRRLVKGLLLGGAAVGLPALANALIARRSKGLPAASWGRGRRYAWRLGEIAYQDLGRGPTVVLVHGLGPGHDAEEWRPVAEALGQRHRVLVPDLLGWGRSDKPQVPYDGELYISLLGDFLEDVVGERAIVVGAGLSAAYALQIAADRPELVDRLGLVTPAGVDVHADEPDVKDALVHWALRLPILGTSALNLYTSRSALSQHLRREAGSSPEVMDAGRVEHHYRSSHQKGAHASLAAVLAGYSNHPVGEALPRCSMPLWLAWGRRATAPPVESADLWLQLASQPRLEIFENSGNLPHVEEAGRFARRLAAFCAGDLDGSVSESPA